MTDMVRARCDVVVIGAGPAGCAAALRASMEGRSVTLVEKNTREGMRGLERTSFEALQNLTQREDALEMLSGMGFDLEPAHPYNGGVVHGPFGNEFSFSLRRLHGHFMRRHGRGSLEEQMLERVERQGVEVLYGTTLRMARPDGTAVLRTDGGRHKIKANVLIGADGRSTSTGSGITGPLGKEDIAIGIGHHYLGDHGFEPGMAECWLGSRTCPGEYAYVLPSRDEVTVVTTFRPHLATKGANPKDYLRRFLRLRKVRERLEGTEEVSTVLGCIPVKAGGPLGKGKVLLVGEAARTTDPMLGFGIKNAIISGHFAGLSSVLDDPLVHYEGLMRASLSSDLRRRMVLRRRMLDVVSDDVLDGLVGSLSSISRTFDPEAIFAPGGTLKAIRAFLRSLPSGRDAAHAVRYLIPFALANYSLFSQTQDLTVQDMGKGEINHVRSIGEGAWGTSGTGCSSSAPIRAP